MVLVNEYAFCLLLAENQENLGTTNLEDQTIHRT